MKKTFARLLPYLRGHGRLVTVMVVTGLIGGAADIIFPLFQRYAINTFVVGNTTEGLGLFTACYLLVLAVQVLTNYISALDACKVEMYVGRDLKREGFNHLQTLSFDYFNRNSVGYIHARVMSDTDRIASLVSWSLIQAVWSGIYIAGAIAAMLSIHWELALWTLAAVPVIMALSVFFQKKLLGMNRQVREMNSRITGALNEGIIGAPTVKTLAAEEKTAGEFEELTGEMRRLAVGTERTRSLYKSLTVFTASVALALVLWRGGVLTESGLMMLGTLSAFMTYAQGLTDPIQDLIESVTSLIAAQVNVERFCDLMDTRSEVKDSPEVIAKYGDSFEPKKENWEPLEGDIEFEDVTFRYPDGEVNVLEHFNLKVPKGTTVAIVGETGAGKSTLVNLLCRFYEPTGGRVLIDGRDARERSQLWLHSHIGYVLQTPHLFSGSVWENLRYGNPEATEEQVRAAVAAVAAEEIVARLPEGYDTDLGEGGGSLSTGEKQLLSIARAVLADPAIFVLDEATSSVDTETEEKIRIATEKLMQGRTSFVIAHRLSTIRHADVILVVHDGAIVERGCHRELMEAKGIYYGLYTRQFREEQEHSSREALKSL